MGGVEVGLVDQRGRACRVRPGACHDGILGPWDGWIVVRQATTFDRPAGGGLWPTTTAGPARWSPPVVVWRRACSITGERPIRGLIGSPAGLAVVHHHSAPVGCGLDARSHQRAKPRRWSCEPEPTDRPMEPIPMVGARAWLTAGTDEPDLDGGSGSPGPRMDR